MTSYSAIKFLEYLVLSRHRRGHGIHSPFVFDLVNRVFRNKMNPEIVRCIDDVRARMLNDNQVIKVTDMGRGSKHMGRANRRISEIARYSSVPARYGYLLGSLAAEFGNSGITELGTSLGISTLYLAGGAGDNPVHTVEGCPETAHAAEGFIRSSGIGNITLHCGSFDEILPSLINREKRPGLVFIDGDHRKDNLLRYFDHIAGYAGTSTVIVIDDIYDTRDMGEAWAAVEKDPRVTLTIDIYRFGLVFFKSGLTRADYTIRY